MLKICTSAKSSSVIYALTKDADQIKEQLILPKIRDFFQAQNVSLYSELDESLVFSDLDYANSEISIEYIYENLLSEISRGIDGTIQIPVKYILTMDKINCPMKCKFTGMNYDAIELHETPFLYFLYVDVESIFKFMRNIK